MISRALHGMLEKSEWNQKSITDHIIQRAKPFWYKYY